MYIQDQAINPPQPPTPELGYGLLYNWYAATDVRGVAPSGFRVPTDAELTTLQNELGGAVIGGGPAKSTRLLADGEPYWDAPNTGATNSSGLNLFPAGNRSSFSGAYQNFRTQASLWSSTVSNTPFYNIPYDLANFSRTAFSSVPRQGNSIRCLSDTEPPTATVQDQDGNDYTWVQIGSQYWLQQNLRTTTYNNGDPIPTGLSNAAWAATTSGAWAYPNGDPTLPI
jgi:uncharacterized protein (TIGR02145 family)